MFPLPISWQCKLSTIERVESFVTTPQRLIALMLIRRFGSAQRVRDFDGSPTSVAQQLVGRLLVRRLGRERLSGIIVEVEAYLAGGDAASHSANGRKRRNSTMFAPAGKLYVY